MIMVPSHWAMVLGIMQRDILDWVEDGDLQANITPHYVTIAQCDLAQFLATHPENVGRVYCEDSLPFINQVRTQLVNEMEAIRDAHAHKGGF